VPHHKSDGMTME